MHVHSSFSEQSGSMAGHLHQAQQNNVDVVWWTDHDYRMSGKTYRKVVHFTDLTGERPAPDEGAAWQWRRQLSGRLATSSTGGIVAHPASPLDPVPRGSLHVSAERRGRGSASLAFSADSASAGWNYRGSLWGQTLYLEVLPTTVTGADYLEIRLSSSYHPEASGRPAGTYALSYRLVPSGAPTSARAEGLLGIVPVPVRVGSWQRVTVRPSEDIARLWPDMDARDFGLVDLQLGAVSTQGPARGYFDYLRIARETSGDVQLRTQLDLQAAYRSKYPRVTQHQGLEVSFGKTHLNWFGGGITLPDYEGYNGGKYEDRLRHLIVPDIHARGGLASLNHPFGVGSGPVLPRAQQDAMLTRVATSALATGALGADILEVGYHQRAGVDLAHHLALWDICSRNALFLTGNGTTDDHFSTAWTGVNNDFVTSAWSTSTDQSALLASLRAGRSWSSSLSRYRGSLDLTADGGCPMGSVSVSTVRRRQVKVHATDLPAGGRISLLQGAVDEAGGKHLSAGIHAIATFTPEHLSTGSATFSVDTSASSFVRTVVHDRKDRIVGLSNPLWLLRTSPSRPVPGSRAH